MKKQSAYLWMITSVIALFALASHVFLPASAGGEKSIAPKYIFLFIVDGGGITHMEITRLYNRVVYDEGMTIPDTLMREGSLGLMTTHAANSLSTDSAAAATALASGCKARLGMLGMCHDGTIPKPTMAIAKEKGMRIGLVTNSTIYDATPAAFLCHAPNRRQYAAIINCYLEREPDLLLGGGKDQFLPKVRPGSRRRDENDLIQAFMNKGYTVVDTKAELDRVADGRVLGLFSLGDMSYEIDRKGMSEPSLSDMTHAAIRLLHNHEHGFFVVVENENVDTAGHQTDLAALIRDYREFDRAVGVAYEFYKKYPEDTLILVTSDHETGGLAFTLALRDLRTTGGTNQAAGTMDDLKKIHSIPISLRKVAEILGPQPTPEGIDRVMQEYFRDFFLAPEFKEAILKQQPISRTIFTNATVNAFGMMIANNTQGYWLTSAHTNQPAFVAAVGNGAGRFRGYQDNSDFGATLKSIVENRK